MKKCLHGGLLLVILGTLLFATISRQAGNDVQCNREWEAVYSGDLSIQSFTLRDTP